ncbi:MAG: PilZ domain-containing protein [Myxococcales bacterium]|jgi:Tfp pilus assembly protein PilZ
MQQTGRQHTRIDYRAPVELLGMGDDGPRKLSAETIDLSRGGMGVHSHERLGVGEEVTCQLELDGRASRLRGRVAWVRPHPDDGHGIGIRFEELPPGELGALNQQLDRATGGQHRVELFFGEHSLPVVARGQEVDGGVRLSAALPVLNRDVALSYRVGHDGPLTTGRVGEVRVREVDGERHIEVDIGAITPEASRHRRRTLYGTPGELRGVRRSEPGVRGFAEPPPLKPAGVRRVAPVLATAIAAAAALGAGVAWWSATPSTAAPAHVVLPEGAWPDEPGSESESAPQNVTEPESVTVAGSGSESERESESGAGSETGTATDPGSGTGAGSESVTGSESVVGSETGTVSGSAPAPGSERAASPIPLPASRASGPERAAPSATALQVEVDGPRTRLSLPFSGSLEDMQSRVWAKPLAIALDLPRGDSALPLGGHPVRRGGVSYVRHNPAAKGIRLRVILQQPIANYSVTREGDTLRIEIDGAAR